MGGAEIDRGRVRVRLGEKVDDRSSENEGKHLKKRRRIH